MNESQDVLIVSSSSLSARSETLSLLESEPDALTRLHADVLPKLAAAQTRPDVLGSPDDRTAALFQAWVAEQSNVSTRPASAGGFEAVLDEKDWIGWASSFFNWVGRLATHPFLPPPAQPTPIPARCRIALLGDWGSGLYGAPVCAASIQRATPAFDVVMHLGDVYYAGTKSEVQTRFLNLWPRVKGATNLALNSNHEMYSGGHGYFGLTLPAFRQRSSLVSLQNDHWMLLCLDTGYDEHRLSDQQLTWLTEQVDVAGSRRVILFSHHQPFSIFESQGDELSAQLSSLLGSGRIFAWYWGHEHRCIVYDRAANGLFGRCIGHSGFPYFRDSLDVGATTLQLGDDRWVRVKGPNNIPSGVVLDGPNPYIAGYEDEYGPHGWASLELSGKWLRERIHRADGRVLYDNTLGG